MDMGSSETRVEANDTANHCRSLIEMVANLMYLARQTGPNSAEQPDDCQLRQNISGDGSVLPAPETKGVNGAPSDGTGDFYVPEGK
jgi:hypothetical protein